jgi:hypothetical protein
LLFRHALLPGRSPPCGRRGPVGVPKYLISDARPVHGPSLDQGDRSTSEDAAFGVSFDQTLSMETIMKNYLSFAVLSASALLCLGSINANAQEMAYPEKCKMEGMAMSGGSMDMSGDMKMGEMTDYQKASMEGMKSMDSNMMQGMMKKDADVSFICGMIAHHMGAISMSEVELKYGDNAMAKEMAQKIIDAQKKEITEMTKWLDKEAK